MQTNRAHSEDAAVSGREREAQPGDEEVQTVRVRVLLR